MGLQTLKKRSRFSHFAIPCLWTYHSPDTGLHPRLCRVPLILQLHSDWEKRKVQFCFEARKVDFLAYLGIRRGSWRRNSKNLAYTGRTFVPLRCVCSGTGPRCWGRPSCRTGRRRENLLGRSRMLEETKSRSFRIRGPGRPKSPRPLTLTCIRIFHSSRWVPIKHWLTLFTVSAHGIVLALIADCEKSVC